jgi:hypothetical protein
MYAICSLILCGSFACSSFPTVAGCVWLFHRRAENTHADEVGLTGACVVGYALGEYTPLKRRESQDHGDGACGEDHSAKGDTTNERVLGVSRKLDTESSRLVYEIVTAWVDPECRGLGYVHMCVCVCVCVCVGV